LLQPAVHPVAIKVICRAMDCAYHTDNHMTAPSYKIQGNLKLFNTFFSKRLQTLYSFNWGHRGCIPANGETPLLYGAHLLFTLVSI